MLPLDLPSFLERFGADEQCRSEPSLNASWGDAAFAGGPSDFWPGQALAPRHLAPQALPSLSQRVRLPVQSQEHRPPFRRLVERAVLIRPIIYRALVLFVNLQD